MFRSRRRVGGALRLGVHRAVDAVFPARVTAQREREGHEVRLPVQPGRGQPGHACPGEPLPGGSGVQPHLPILPGCARWGPPFAACRRPRRSCGTGYWAVGHTPAGAPVHPSQAKGQQNTVSGEDSTSSATSSPAADPESAEPGAPASRADVLGEIGGSGSARFPRFVGRASTPTRRTQWTGSASRAPARSPTASPPPSPGGSCCCARWATSPSASCTTRPARCSS